MWNNTCFPVSIPTKLSPMPLSRRRFTNSLLAAGVALPFVGAGRSIQETAPASRETIRLNLFSKGMEWLDYDAFTDVVLAAGCQGIDVTVRDGGHVLPQNVERDLPKLVDIAKKKWLQVPLMVTSITSATDPFAEQIIQTAAQLGITAYRMGYFRYDPKRNMTEYLQACATKLQGLANLNQKYGIQAGYQNHHGAYIGAPVLDIWQLISRVDQRYVSLQYDTAHAQVEGVFSWPIALQLVKGRIGSLALKDFRWELAGSKLRVTPVPIGEGSVDFSAFFQTVQAERIQVPFTLHVEYPMLTEADKSLSITQQMKKIVPVLKRDADTIRALWLAA